MDHELFFFVGTEAELIKIFPVIIEARNNGLTTHIIASGQNDIKNSDILRMTDCGRIDIELSDEVNIRKSAKGLVSWWIKTYAGSKKKIAALYGEKTLKSGIMIVHGDTVSTYMGARLGRNLGMTVCHVEAGLRSHHLFNPFPEEIDRLLTSRVARIHFAPGSEAKKNLSHAKGKVIDTEQNTLLDSLRISEDFLPGDVVKRIIMSAEPYFVFVMHRQENLSKSEFVCKVIEVIERKAAKQKAFIVGHVITVNTLKKYGLFDRLRNNANISIIPRMGYFDFMKLLKNAEYVITDGGSNQEELYYMNKPTLILRKTTERNEGIGRNVRLFKDLEDIEAFPTAIMTYNNGITNETKPSEKIVSFLKMI